MEDAKRAVRRRHSAELKTQVLTQCSQPGASVAQVALVHGLNANVVHRWRRLAGCAPGPSAMGAVTAFVPMTLPPQATPTTLPDIRIELRRGGAVVNISWPAQGASDCAAWLRDWLR